MKFIDFFSGVGGFRRGMELAGHECVGFCEFDKFAVASYTAMHLHDGKGSRVHKHVAEKQKSGRSRKGGVQAWRMVCK